MLIQLKYLSHYFLKKSLVLGSYSICGSSCSVVISFPGFTGFFLLALFSSVIPSTSELSISSECSFWNVSETSVSVKRFSKSSASMRRPFSVLQRSQTSIQMKQAIHSIHPSRQI
ncbi:Hypothetical_protein [Hexamita inflata]|uniref:Hypothetical_protein n=1 Tax=Hexamita inflata TaxID=28002 RepID=A0AA86QK51_9EUKA|nr:Hypothetical protein HINF_LOCUS42802 [Hexamita inflata]CAI9965870.1 Hypothetical protein HINF_LOCUS53515 [Hexamita inflata]CAI9965874.1 Hypothetical protein HINF_LOCUS53519 [Hexamita inflata]